ncbi:MAG: endonuclease [Prevotella sp.]|nr:endonuclease [Prevotella sp.]
MKKILLIAISAVFALGVFAQGPNGSNTYYKNADGLSGEGLKTALSKIICGSLDAVGYNSLDEKYKITDKRADGTLRDWYDNTTKYNWTSGGWNKEHLVPQSWFKEASPMKSDIVHVVPTDSELNNTRGSDPLAEVGNKANDCPNGSYCLWGSCKTPGYSGKVFEPNDEIKGDIARIYFYMATCYEDVILNWKGKTTASTAYDVLDFTGGTKYQPFKQWYMNMLLRWAKEDPVDEIENARNNGVKQVQNNRNPFVDYPGLEQYIWGSKKNDSFSYSNYVEPTEYVIEYGSSGSGTGGNTGDETGGGEQGSETPENATIALNNTFFNCSYSGSINSSDSQDLVGTQNGITVNYSLSSGANRYCNDSQIRLYQNNTLTVSVGEGTITKIEFELAASTSKTLSASTGTMNGLVWTGNASSVVFTVNSGSGNMQIKNIKVTVSVPSGINGVKTNPYNGQQMYNLKGQRVKRPGKGIYIKNRKKIIIN